MSGAELGDPQVVVTSGARFLRTRTVCVCVMHAGLETATSSRVPASYARSNSFSATSLRDGFVVNGFHAGPCT